MAAEESRNGAKQFVDVVFDRPWVHWYNVAVTILAWLAIVLVGFWILDHIARTLIVLVTASLLAYALAPAVKQLTRFMPRYLAIGIIYILVFGGVGVFAVLTFSTAAHQLSLLIGDLKALQTPANSSQTSQLVQSLEQLGFSQDQVNAAGQQIFGQLQSIAGQVVPVLLGIFSALLDILVIAVLSIYFMIDGLRVKDWLQTRIPLSQRDRVSFLLDTLERVVGGYIRGQLILSTLIGVLVGVGMYSFHVPYAILLGVLAFILEFIPIVGTLTSGAICFAIALSQGWVVATFVLLYFIGVHIIEGDVIGPRIVGRAVGLHPAASMVALILGSELFGVWGALFAAPTAGVLQSIIRTGWIEWRELHPEQFPAEPTARATVDLDLDLNTPTQWSPAQAGAQEPQENVGAFN